MSCPNCGDIGHVTSYWGANGAQPPQRRPCGCRPLLQCDTCPALFVGPRPRDATQDAEREANAELMRLAEAAAWQTSPHGRDVDHCPRCKGTNAK